MPNAADVPWHRSSVTSSPSRRCPVGFTAGNAPMYDVSTLRRKSLDRRRKLRLVCLELLSLVHIFLHWTSFKPCFMRKFIMVQLAVLICCF